MDHTAEIYQHAVQRHRAGAVQEAISLYLQLLPQLAQPAELLFLLGTAQLQCGQKQEGIARLQQSLALDPAQASAWNNLGNAWCDQHCFDDALQCYAKALALQADFADAHNNLGIALKGLQRPEQALASYERALLLQPQHAGALRNRAALQQELAQRPIAVSAVVSTPAPSPSSDASTLQRQGDLLCQQRRFDEALRCYEQVLVRDPEAIGAYLNRGVALTELHQYHAALASFDQAVLRWPDFADAHYNRGKVLKELGRSDEAITSYRKALRLRPQFVLAHNNLGNALAECQLYGQALACYTDALAIDANFADAHLNRANALKELGHLDAALLSYDQALRCRPEYADVYWNKALCLLLDGQYGEGWALYEWRLRMAQFRKDFHQFPQLAWRGQETIAAKRLLVHAEQGLGDMIQFCRYLPMLHQLGAQLIVEAPAPLLGLLATLACPMTLVEQGQPLPAFDAYCPVMSLPLALGTTLATIPAELPYLSSDPARVQAWQQTLGQPKGRRIGLVWSGAAAHGNDGRRSLSLARLSGLLELPGFEWHALQKEVRPADAEILQQLPAIRQHQHALQDFADTAALIACMDLVISVDTSVAHLAGALGKPVWILLAAAPDYRWMLARDDSPWYPTAQLYRQTTPGDWDSVIARVALALSR